MLGMLPPSAQPQAWEDGLSLGGCLRGLGEEGGERGMGGRKR